MPLGKVESFHVGTQDWDAYVRRVKQFIALNNIEPNLHVATLVTLVGADCYALMCDLCSPVQPEDKTFDELVKLVKDHLEPERSEIAERHIFRQRKQQEGEEVKVYLQNLKHLARTCSFGAQLEVNLRDQFVSGLHSEEMRSRLFAEKNIDYRRAVELALALEAAERHAMTACATTATSATAATYVVKTVDGRVQKRHVDQILTDKRKSRHSLALVSPSSEDQNSIASEVRDSEKEKDCQAKSEEGLLSDDIDNLNKDDKVTNAVEIDRDLQQNMRSRRTAALECIQKVKRYK